MWGVFKILKIGSILKSRDGKAVLFSILTLLIGSVIFVSAISSNQTITNDIIVNNKFSHLKGFKQIGFTMDYDNIAIESFDKKIISSEENLKNRFTSQSLEVESIYEEVDTSFFNVDEKPVKQTYILKNLLDTNKNIKLNIIYEIDSDFVVWNGTEYIITNKPIYFEAFEVTEEIFGLNETFLTGHTLYFGNNYYDFEDVINLDYAVSVYSLNNKNYIDLEINGEVEALNELIIDPVIGWTTHVITTSASGAQSVYAIDVDSDGDVDVLSASRDDDKIAWYENNGSQSFTAHTITTSADGAKDVFAIDLDKDNDIDVLSASRWDHRIAWYENDGSESFTTHDITNATVDANGANEVFAIDLDKDGDIDVLSASYYDNKIAWYENNGSESFTSHAITTSAIIATAVYAIDVDSDGDIDALSASAYDDKIAWYENNGSESFTAHTITTSTDEAESVFAIDVDSDGDIDVLSASFFDHKIAWYENNGSESFTAHTITTGAMSAWSVYAIDVDSDGDIDVLSASGSDDKIAWYENNGSESFAGHTITTSADLAKSVFAIDVDLDGDIDVLSASLIDNKIAWYESNLTIEEEPNYCNGTIEVIVEDLDGYGINNSKIYVNSLYNTSITNSINTEIDIKNTICGTSYNISAYCPDDTTFCDSESRSIDTNPDHDSILFT